MAGAGGQQRLGTQNPHAHGLSGSRKRPAASRLEPGPETEATGAPSGTCTRGGSAALRSVASGWAPSLSTGSTGLPERLAAQAEGAMNASLLPHLFDVVTPGLAAVGPAPALALVMQVAGFFGLIGSAVALRAKRRDPDVDTWRITSAWTTLGTVVGCVVVAVDVV
jgi:hypothetical protein